MKDTMGFERRDENNLKVNSPAKA